MVPKKNRLPLQTVLRAARNSADAVRTPLFILVKRRNGMPVNRFGVLVPKKFDKRSSKRNALRRALFRAAQTDGLRTPASKAAGTDIAVYISPRASGEPRDRVVEEVRAAVRRILKPRT